MTLHEFIDKYIGEYVEVAGSADAKNQCVDLVNAYLRDVLNHPIVEWTNAVDFPKKLTDMWWMPNEATNYPENGDIVVWGGTYGHIAIAVVDEDHPANANYFYSFDQNYPTGSDCHIERHTYLKPKVLGWLHPEEQSMSVMYKNLDLTNQDSMKAAVDIWVEVMIQKLWVKLSEFKELFDVTGKPTIVEAITEVNNRLEQIGRLKDQLTTETKLRIELASSLSGCEDAVRIYENDIVARQATINEQAKRIGELQTENAKLQDALQKPSIDVQEEKPQSISKNSTLEQVIAWIKNLIFSNKN